MRSALDFPPETVVLVDCTGISISYATLVFLSLLHVESHENVCFKVASESVQVGNTASPPTADAASPGALDGNGRVSTAVHAKNLEMKLEEMEDVKKGLELELRAMKLEQHNDQIHRKDEQQKLQV
jgi:hypothetical protein